MYYQSSANPNDPSPDSDRLKTLLDNLNNLRGKLRNFTVIDELGQPIGEISDLILDAGHQLNLVISQPDAQGQPSVLLNGRRIKKVSVQTESVFVDITKADVPFLPEYLLPDGTAEPSKVSELPNPIASLPAPAAPIVPPPAIDEPTPDFSLDVMEPPIEAVSVPTSPLPDPLTSVSSDLGSSDLGSDSGSLDDILVDDSSTIDDASSIDDAALEAGELGWADDDAIDLDFLDLQDTAPSATTSEDLFLELPNEARSLDEFTLAETSEPTTLEPTTLEPTANVADLDLQDADFSLDTFSLDTTSADDELDFSLDTTSAGSDRSNDLPTNTIADVELTGLLEDSDDDPVAEAFILDDSRGDDLELPDLNLESSALPDLSLIDEPDRSITMPDLGAADSTLQSEWDEFDREIGFNAGASTSSASVDAPSLDTSFDQFSLSEPSAIEADDSADTLDLAELDFELNDRSPEAANLPDSASAQTDTNELEEMDFGFDTVLQGESVSDVESLDVESLDVEALDLDFETEEPLGTQESSSLSDFDFAAEPQFAPLPELNLTGDESAAETLELDLGDLDESTLDTEPLDFEADDLGLDTIAAAPNLNLAEPQETSDTIESLADLDFSTDANDVSAEILFDADPTNDLTTPADSALDLELSNLDLSDSGEIAISDLDANPAYEPDTSLDLNLDNLDQEFALDAPAASDSAGFTADLVEPPSLNLDDLELSSTPTLPPTTPPIEAIDDPIEFGLESVPAQTYDVPSASEGTASDSQTVDTIMPLLEERLKVEYDRRKIGEVIIRKQVETRMVQVPVRYEKLVIEQVGLEGTLAEVDLSQGALDELEGVELPGVSGKPIVSAQFKSPKTASHVLDALSKTLRHRCKNVRIEIELEDEKLQQAYQEWLNQCSRM